MKPLSRPARSHSARLRLEPLDARDVPAFLAPIAYPAGANPQAVVAGNFTADAAPDLAVADTNGDVVTVLAGNGDGTFRTGVSSPTGHSPHAIVAADFNRDGKLDVVTANAADVTLLLGDGAGGFAAPVGIPLGSLANPRSLAVGDFNADGNPDLALTSNYNGGWVSVFLGDGRGNFVAAGSALVTNLDSVRDAVVADFDGDGRPDVGVADSNGVVSVFRGDGRGGLQFYSSVQTGAGSDMSVAAGDVNGDGRPDLVTAAQAYSVSVVVALNDGFGHFTADYNYSVGTRPVAIALADLNGDGRPDVVTADAGSSDVAVLLGKGDGHFQSPVITSLGTSPAGLSVADLNGDGRPDVATADPAANAVSVLVNAAGPSALAVAGFPSPTTAGAAGTFTVRAADAYGNTLTTYTGTVAFTSSDSQAVLPVNYTFSAADRGVHTFTATLKTAGSQSLTATDTWTSTTGTELGITVKAAAAARLLLTAPSGVTVGTPFSLTVTAKDAYGNTATGYVGTVKFTSTDGTATLPANYTFTAADGGTHTFTGLVLRKRGTQKVTVTDTLSSALTATASLSVQ